MNLIRIPKANLAALRRFVRKPIRGRVKVVAVFETQGRARTRPESDWKMGPDVKVVRHRVAGTDSDDMLKGEKPKALAASLAEELKRAFEGE